MMDTIKDASAAPVHRYTARCAWSGSTGVGYENYSREHEQLLVMAAASCQLLSFLAVAARARLDVVAYEDEAAAEMPEGDKPVRIVSIRLRPRIVLAGGVGNEERVRQLVEIAHRECYIANSLKTEVTVEPVIEWQN